MSVTRGTDALVVMSHKINAEPPPHGYVVAFQYFFFSDFCNFLSQGGLLHMLNKQA